MYQGGDGGRPSEGTNEVKSLEKQEKENTQISCMSVLVTTSYLERYYSLYKI